MSERSLPPLAELLPHSGRMLLLDELEVTAIHVWGEEMLGSFRGHVARAGAVVATCELSVYAGDLIGVLRDSG